MFDYLIVRRLKQSCIDMEEFKNERKEQEIVFSKSVKAGKRIYYLDVKRSRNNDLFLAITESKKKFAEDENAPVMYEKHKIFLYKEDFEKFTDALTEIIGFINENNAANGARDIREFRSYRAEQPVVAEVAEEAPVEEAAPVTEEKKYDFDVDFEI